MRDPVGVRLGETRCDLHRYVDRLVETQRTALDPLLQGISLVAGYDDEHLAVRGLIYIADCADIRMLEGGGRLGLLNETLICGVLRDDGAGRNFRATKESSLRCLAL